MFHKKTGKPCALQIIDAQKARLKRELETLQTRLDAAVAGKERAGTLVCQLRADLADMSAERDASADKQEQRAHQLQQRVAELETQLESAARPEDEGVFDMEPDASIEEVQVCLAPGTLEVLCIASTSKAIPKMATWACDAGICTTLHAHDDCRGME